MEQMWMSSLKCQVKMPSRIASWHWFRKDSSRPSYLPQFVTPPRTYALCLSLCGNFHRHRMDFLDPWLWAGLICFDQQDISRREAETYSLSVWMTCPPVLCHGSEKNVPQEVAVPGKIKGHEEDLNWACISGPSLLAQSSCLNSLSTSSAYICPPPIHGWGVWGCLVTQHY